MIDEPQVYRWILIGWVAVAVVAFFLLMNIAAPYGRFYRKGWGPGIPARLGWFLMESTALWMVLALFLLGGRRDPVSIVFCLIWCGHYSYRGLLYPMRLRSGRFVSLFVVLSGIAFNLTNGYLQGRHLFAFADPYPTSWFRDPRFVVGVVLFAIGLVVTIRSDNALRRLRAKTETGYAIPHGGMFRWISCPNYFGELLEWSAWALLTWSPAGLAFAIWVVANLIPRAIAYHRWYRSHFPDYPPQRKAVIPYIL